MEAMKARGIQTSIHYPPIHKFSAFQGSGEQRGQGLGVTEALAAREVTLPLYPALTQEQVRQVVDAVREALEESGVETGSKRTNLA
jgi:dTDP-4-amino-4,6-dideoxygalactose transaminase